MAAGQTLASLTPRVNAYNKYSVSNPIERRLMRGFFRALDACLPETAPVRMLEVFRLAQARELDVHPRVLKLITRNSSRIDQALRDDPDRLEHGDDAEHQQKADKQGVAHRPSPRSDVPAV